MKNIWILNHYAKPFGGRHHNFAKNLIKKGYDVKIFSASTFHKNDENLIGDSKRYEYKEFGGVPFILINATEYVGNEKKRFKNMLDYAYRLLSISKKFDTVKPDVILASSVHPLTWISGYMLAKRYKAKFIAETRDLWPETLVAMKRIKRNSIPAKVLYKIEKIIYKKADKIIFTMPGGKDYLSDRGIDNNHSRNINNGIDLELFNEQKEKFAHYDTTLDKEKTFKIIYTGSMGIANSLNYIIEAARIIEEEGIGNIEFVLYGDGYQRKELEEHVNKKNINNVIFKGRVESKYIPYILTKSDLNIFTGQNIYLYKYGLSLNKMFSYFASGKPTVSNINCGYDLLQKYRSGITVKGGSVEALVRGILAIYNMSEKEYQDYCKNALIAAEDFDYKVLSQKLEEVMLEE